MLFIRIFHHSNRNESKIPTKWISLSLYCQYSETEVEESGVPDQSKLREYLSIIIITITLLLIKTTMMKKSFLYSNFYTGQVWKNHF